MMGLIMLNRSHPRTYRLDITLLLLMKQHFTLVRPVIVDTLTLSLSIFLFSSVFLFLPLQTLTQPSCHDNPIHAACFLILQSIQNPPAAVI